MSRIIFVGILGLLLNSCANKYEPFRSQYDFKSKDGKPDYSDLQYWAAHPMKWDPSDSVPRPLRNEPQDSTVDVFFIHPTTYTDKMKTDNAAIDDDYINAKTDYSAILYQASVFNAHCRVFAPRYRQAAIKMFFDKDEAKRKNALAIAYADVAASFAYYLQHWNGGRPIIIAGHSQGSLLAEQLLKDFFEDKPLANQLVVAFVAGWPVAKEYFGSLKMCTDSMQTGCICSWRTLRNGYVPPYVASENGNSYVTNPLTWRTDSLYGPKTLNKGSVLFKFNKVYKHTTDAQISRGVLFIRKPKFPWSFLYFTRNYHIGDINLFYLNIRENIGQRIRSFKTK